MSRNILAVADDWDSRCGLTAALSGRGLEVATVCTAEEALALVTARDFDAVLTDVELEGMTGLELCAQIVRSRPGVPVIVASSFGSFESALGALRAGACDFVTKPFAPEEIVKTLERAIARKELGDEVKRLRVGAPESTRDGRPGTSATMARVHELVARVAETEATVLVTGESGTGKEIVAQAIHARSRRAAGPFVAINCAAMPESLLESELFGHVKGAFTDARQARHGLFLQARGGTLLLDEIGEMPAGMQAKLLRVLQERVVRPVGGETEVPFDARIIAATNRDLDAEVRERRFREDLFYRINVVRVHLPPLRERGMDVLDLAQSFITRFARLHHVNVRGLAPAAAERLLAYHWPGNVRELQNCIERAVALASHDLLLLDDLPDRLREYSAPHASLNRTDPVDLRPMDEIERRYVYRVLEASGGNKSRAAEVLGFDRRTLYRKLERYEHGTNGIALENDRCQVQ
jgi:two-component system response regulator HydG